MKSPVTKLAAAAGLILAVVLPATLLIKSTPIASAAVILQQAAEAMGKLKSFHIRVEMRTLPHDNFALVVLDHDFVPIDFWKQVTDEPEGKWRLEEPGRVVVMDGRLSSMFFKATNEVHEVSDLSPQRYWDECLVEVDKVTEREAKNASEHPAQFSLYREQGEDGREKIVISVEVQSRVPETDPLRDAYIENSDHLKIYRFDAQTKLLENLEIYIHHEDQDILVLRLVQAEYDVALDPALFRLDLPEDVIRSVPLAVLPDNAKYEQMTPKEAATAFFQACAEENWDELVKFMGRTAVPQLMKDYLGGLEIISIGEPFQSANYSGWFVPYEVKLKSGQVKKHNLAIRKDNPANRFEYDGGI